MSGTSTLLCWCVGAGAGNGAEGAGPIWVPFLGVRSFMAELFCERG